MKIQLWIFLLLNGYSQESNPDIPPLNQSSTEAGKSEYIALWKPWQKEISEFINQLKKISQTAQIPTLQEFRKRLQDSNGETEIITDGYGGIVDFGATKGTIQYLTNNTFGSAGEYSIDWTFTLAGDTRINYDKSTHLIPEKASILKPNKQGPDQWFFCITINKSQTGPYKAGDRIRLQSSIDDFSRFRKNYRKALGIISIYHLEENPNPVFVLKLDEAEITLLEPGNNFHESE